MHFLITGILERPKDPEPANLVCLDESLSDVMKAASAFGWNLQRLMDLKQLIIIDAFSGRLGLKPNIELAIPIGKFSIEEVLRLISESMQVINAQRLVIDPITALLDGMEETERRTSVLQMLVTAVMRKVKRRSLLQFTHNCKIWS